MSTALRIRGARVLAGFMSGTDVAGALDFSSSKYVKLESGVIALGVVDRAAISKLFAVTEGYLETGAPGTERDRQAARLSDIIGRAGDTGPGVASERLREARTLRGFRSARAAASRHGWSEQTFGAYERGSVALSTERLIGFALGFGVRPEYVVFGMEPIEPSPSEVIKGWADFRAVQAKERPAKSINWRWLKKQTVEETVTIYLLELSDSALVRSEMRPLVLPAQALRSKAISPYGIVERTDAGELEITVIDPSVPMGERVAFLEDGVLAWRAQTREDFWAIDPLSPAATKSRSILLGSWIGKVSVG